MQEKINPPEPPRSSVETVVPRNAEAYFFTTSIFKLAVMSICTFGIYEQYWFYKNWVLIKERTGKNIMPFWRAVFAPLFAYSCFNYIKESANEKNVPESLSIGLLAIVYVIIWGLSGAYWFVPFFKFIVLVHPNGIAVNINKHLMPNFKNNETFTGWNWLGVALGGLFFLLNLMCTFFPEA